MRKILYNISEKIDSFKLKVLKQIKSIADSLQIDFFIIGATVRDMILNYVYEIPIYRATNDIDFAVRLRSWDEYNDLTTEIAKLGYKRDDKIVHRYYCNGLIIDFIPFGDIADNKKSISWQGAETKEMNILGFDDAFTNAEEMVIQTDPEISIKVASVESLVMLKLFAWNDRDAEIRIKDTRDLYLIMTTYLKAGNEERLFEENSDIVEVSLDYEFSGARLLGRDIAKIASVKVIEALLSMLEDEKLVIMANEMSRYEGILSDQDEKTERSQGLLENLRMGLTDKV